MNSLKSIIRLTLCFLLFLPLFTSCQSEKRSEPFFEVKHDNISFLTKAEKNNLDRLAKEKNQAVYLCVVTDTLTGIQQLEFKEETAKKRDAGISEYGIVIIYYTQSSSFLVSYGKYFQIYMEHKGIKQLSQLQYHSAEYTPYNLLKEILNVFEQADSYYHEHPILARCPSMFLTYVNEHVSDIMPSSSILFSFLHLPFAIAVLLIRICRCLWLPILLLFILGITFTMYGSINHDWHMFMSVLQWLNRFVLIYVVLFTVPSYDNFLYVNSFQFSGSVSDILQNIYLSQHWGLSSSIFWSIFAVILILILLLLKILDLVPQNVEDINDQWVESFTDQLEEPILIVIGFASVFLLPTYVTQTVCLFLLENIFARFASFGEKGETIMYKDVHTWERDYLWRYGSIMAYIIYSMFICMNNLCIAHPSWDILEFPITIWGIILYATCHLFCSFLLLLSIALFFKGFFEASELITKTQQDRDEADLFLPFFYRLGSYASAVLLVILGFLMTMWLTA